MTIKDNNSNKKGNRNPFEAHMSAEELRISKIMDEVRSKYIPSARDKDLAKGLDFLIKRTLLTRTPNLAPGGTRRPEARGLVVLGDSRCGKSTAIERMLMKHPALPDYTEPSCPVISVSAKSPVTLMALGKRLLKKLGYPIDPKRELKQHVVWDMAFATMQELGTKILHIDEVQNITTPANIKEAAWIRDTFKGCLNDCDQPLNLILSGLPELGRFLDQDQQLRERMHFLQFEPITNKDAKRIEAAIQNLAETAGLKVEIADDLANRLIHAAHRAMGLCFEMTCDAIENALENRAETLTIKNFAAQYAERKRCAPLANPFLAHAWWDIDTERSLQQNPQQTLIEKAQEEIQSAKSRKQRK
jgi:hypothetical protein